LRSADAGGFRVSFALSRTPPIWRISGHRASGFVQTGSVYRRQPIIFGYPEVRPIVDKCRVVSGWLSDGEFESTPGHTEVGPIQKETPETVVIKSVT
jgi:hypothetical protein